MGGLAGILLSLGGPVLAHALGEHFGKGVGELAQKALDVLGAAFGVEPNEDAVTTAINDAQSKGGGVAEARVKVAEADMAAVYLAQAKVLEAGNDQQRMTNELLQAQMKEGSWFASAWLYVWQWFLMFVWGWTVLLVPAANAALRIFGAQTSTDLITGAVVVAAPSIPTVDLGVLMTLTGLYLSLHMGGHTVLELVRNQWGGLFGAKAKDTPGSE